VCTSIVSTARLQNEAWYLYGGSCVYSQEALDSSAHELLFLHGRYETTEHWKTLTDQLDFGARSTFIDLPGFGRSFTMDGKSLSLGEHVEITTNYILSRNHELILVGHDVGGIVVQLAALETQRQAPHLIKGLILLNSSSLNHLHCPKWKYFLAHEMKKLIHSSEKLLLEHREKMHAPEFSHIHTLSTSWPDEPTRIELHWKMRNFDKPVLVLWGNRDSLNPPNEVNDLMANYPNVELFQDDTIGHWPWLEYPEWVSTKVQEFLFKLGNSEVSQKSFQD
jgi:pimeloyl-ACP methyl ester carboxylesterase